jgi:hypothetical protein
MYTTYYFKPREITDIFLKMLQETNRDREIAVTIEEVEDETLYISKFTGTNEEIMRSLEALQSGKPKHVLTIEQIENMLV